MVLIPKSTYERWQLDRDGKTDAKVNDDNTGSTSGSKDEPVSDKATDPDSDSDAHKRALASVSNDHTVLPAPIGEQTSTDTRRITQTLLSKFSEDYRLYAKRLLTYIGKHGRDILAWNDENNALVYKGNLIEDSDIVELVTHIFKTNARPPKGFDSFRKGIDVIRVPKAYLKPYLLKPPGIPRSIKKKWIKY